MAALPEIVDVVIETPRGSLVKWDSTGGVAFISPIPAPFNYGSVPGTLADDAAPQDALVLGPRLPRGHRAPWTVHGVVRFVDGGWIDDKWVCGPRAPTWIELARLRAFFRAYAWLKTATTRLRGRRGPSRFEGYTPRG